MIQYGTMMNLLHFLDPKRKLGRWLGEAADFGQAICYWILSDTAKPIVRSTIQAIPRDKLTLEATITQLKSLDNIILNKLGSPSPIDSLYSYDLEPNDENHDLDEEFRTPAYSPVDPQASMPEADEWDAEAFDQYISAEVKLPRDGTEVLGQVIA